ncbi:MAG: hypothetical protein LH618_14505 [Saprospiraceae bacterium]|nr:hypothetical protein [Saprospiraceae bacterium]
MQHIISIIPPRFQERDAYPTLMTRLPICGLVLLVSIPAALLTVLIMGFVQTIRFFTKSF